MNKANLDGKCPKCQTQMKKIIYFDTDEELNNQMHSIYCPVCKNVKLDMTIMKIDYEKE